MTNTKLLNDEIEKSGFKREWIAKQCNITRAALFSKINNESEFKASEICRLTQILGLSNSQRDLIFLTDM
ncbi:MAG: toxin-antitoxin system, antitoxin component, Xre family protein [Clostridia bacterium]|nr:toxin-antitoxin system, antitoxin component, Xre family protein [Clostridia bacterium]